MIMTVQLDNPKQSGTVLMEALKRGLETQRLGGNQIEFIGEEKRILSALGSVRYHVVHREMTKLMRLDEV